MSFVNEIVVTTAVAEFRRELEHRLAADDKFVECVCQPNWRTFRKRMSAFQRSLNKHTKKKLNGWTV